MRHRVGVYSRPGPLADLDLRTREGRYLKQFRTELLQHLGGTASPTQRELVARASWLSLRCCQLDAKIAAGEDFTLHDSRTYLAWSNSLARALRQLGLKPAEAPAPTLADHLARRADAGRAA